MSYEVYTKKIKKYCELLFPESMPKLEVQLVWVDGAECGWQVRIQSLMDNAEQRLYLRGDTEIRRKSNDRVYPTPEKAWEGMLGSLRIKAQEQLTLALKRVSDFEHVLQETK